MALLPIRVKFLCRAILLTFPGGVGIFETCAHPVSTRRWLENELGLRSSERFSSSLHPYSAASGGVLARSDHPDRRWSGISPVRG